MVAERSDTRTPERRITLTSNVPHTEHLGDFVEDFGRRHGLGASLVFELSLALDELVTNISTHGCHVGEPSSIYISLRCEGAELVAVVEDDGPAFDPCQVPPPDVSCPLEERCIGGLGIHLVRNLMDAMSYEREEGVNRLILRKKIGAM